MGAKDSASSLRLTTRRSEILVHHFTISRSRDLRFDSPFLNLLCTAWTLAIYMVSCDLVNSSTFLCSQRPPPVWRVSVLKGFGRCSNADGLAPPLLLSISKLKVSAAYASSMLHVSTSEPAPVITSKTIVATSAAR